MKQLWLLVLVFGFLVADKQVPGKTIRGNLTSGFLDHVEFGRNLLLGIHNETKSMVDHLASNMPIHKLATEVKSIHEKIQMKKADLEADIKRIKSGIQSLKTLHIMLHKMILNLGFNPMGLLQDRLLPDAKKVMKANPERLKQCYDSQVGNRKLDIFKETLHSIALNYFKSYVQHLEGIEPTQVPHRTQALLEALRRIGSHVIECANNNDTTTRLGLTSESALTVKEFRNLTSIRVEEEATRADPETMDTGPISVEVANGTTPQQVVFLNGTILKSFAHNVTTSKPEDALTISQPMFAPNGTSLQPDDSQPDGTTNAPKMYKSKHKSRVAVTTISPPETTDSDPIATTELDENISTTESENSKEEIVSTVQPEVNGTEILENVIDQDNEGNETRHMLGGWTHRKRPGHRHFHPDHHFYIEQHPIIEEIYIPDHQHFQPQRKFQKLTTQRISLEETPERSNDHSHQKATLTGGIAWRKCDYLDQPVPNKFDWRSEGIVSPMFNMGQCSACFLFSTVWAMESAYMRKSNKKNIRFSKQNLLNCLDKKRNICDEGDYMDNVYSLAGQKGLQYEKEREYTAKQMPSRCRQQGSVATLQQYCVLTNLRDDLSLQQLVHQLGPVTVVYNPHGRGFMDLKGEYNYKSCSADPKELSHSGLLIGWTESHWIIKNMYGEDWGLKGYFHLKKGGNRCGIYTRITVPFF